ncbi:MAG: alpha/beta hydrolase [Cetobacterium sp.]
MKKLFTIFMLINSIVFSVGMLEEGIVYSETLKKDINYVTYLPKDYNKEKEYPVLYLLHGLYGNEKDWSNPQVGNMALILDSLIEEKQSIDPMIVIMPDAGNSWYIDSKELVKTAFEKDFFSEIEKKYKISQNREKKGIAGLSMGGHGSLLLFLENPEKYGNLIIMSPAAYKKLNSRFMEISPVTDADIEKSYYKNNLVKFYNSNFKTNVFISVGDDDNLTDGYDNLVMQQEALDIYQVFKSKSNNPELRIYDGGHNWSIWRKSLEEGLINTFGKNKE